MAMMSAVALTVVTDAWHEYSDMILAIALRLLYALLILVIGNYAIGRMMHYFRILLRKRRKLDKTLAGFIESVFRFLLRFLLLIVIFGQLGIENDSFIAIIGASVFALAFALQGALSNFAAGLMLLTFRPFKVGDYVRIAGETGFVARVELFTTVLMTRDGIRVVCPNGDVTGQVMRNMSAGVRRVDLVFSISYSDNITLAKRIIRQVLREYPRTLSYPEPEIGLISMGDNSINLMARPWVKPAHYWQARRELPEIVKVRFDELDITIPFPQRDLHIIPPEPEEHALKPFFDSVSRSLRGDPSAGGGGGDVGGGDDNAGGKKQQPKKKKKQTNSLKQSTPPQPTIAQSEDKTLDPVVAYRPLPPLNINEILYSYISDDEEERQRQLHHDGARFGFTRDSLFGNDPRLLVVDDDDEERRSESHHVFSGITRVFAPKKAAGSDGSVVEDDAKPMRTVDDEAILNDDEQGVQLSELVIDGERPVKRTKTKKKNISKVVQRKGAAASSSSQSAAGAAGGKKQATSGKQTKKKAAMSETSTSLLALGGGKSKRRAEAADADEIELKIQ
eukprot:TRINITY_DN65949_c10_g1_i1.p1 TRINITY_DN65949_c10_g1~~TRINITY_DN65949_c10_g1_i1.p1  ORF type:complete len:563 (-),score=295.85 TRINITY_DN65949_c10_g1_i1:566-2254(-)